MGILNALGRDRPIYRFDDIFGQYRYIGIGFNHVGIGYDHIGISIGVEKNIGISVYWYLCRYLVSVKVRHFGIRGLSVAANEKYLYRYRWQKAKLKLSVSVIGYQFL